MRKANNFHKMAFIMKMSYFCTHFVSLCCYNPFITIFTVAISHRGSFILYLMPHTLRYRMARPTKWPVRQAKSQISLDIRPVWSASSLCEGPNIYWCGQRRLWSDWENGQTDLNLRWAHAVLLVLSCGGSFSFQFLPNPIIPLHIW